MESRFAIAGHPLHPALVALPIGVFTWALVANLVYLGSDNDRTWYEISYWSSIAGIAGALLAAIPGFVDGFTIGKESDARDKVYLHMTLNLVVLGLFAGAVLLMRDNGAIDGTQLGVAVGLQAVAVGLLALAGWIGGEMVFRHHLASIPEDAEVRAEEHRRHGRVERPARRNPFAR